MLSRRDFIIAGISSAIACGIGTFKFNEQDYDVPGSIQGPSFVRGHSLWQNDFPEPEVEFNTDILIVGGGVSGLSAANYLKDSKMDNFLLLELENLVGGNSSSGRNSVSAYPWGAHYLPFPNEETEYTRALLEELKVITDYQNGLPVFDPYYLTFEPQERLYIYGKWQNGLMPLANVNGAHQDEYYRFNQLIHKYSQKRDYDNKYGFCIPLDMSSQDPELLKLDQVSMKDFLLANNLKSDYLHWYINYCCRDDYGVLASKTSAWMGLHYFCSRRGLAANAENHNVLSWSEGNGWLVNKLKSKVSSKIKAGLIAYDVKQKSDYQIETKCFDFKSNTSILIKSKSAILATPRFVTNKIYQTEFQEKLSYAPWIVANITTNILPQGNGSGLSWDNVVYNSPHLGYVDATHQSLKTFRKETVLTYYWPVSHLDGNQAREYLSTLSFEDLRLIVLKELFKTHPELSGKIANIDFFIWAHAMIAPEIGFIWGEGRKKINTQQAPIFYAHSDMSGMSIFEEAQYHGITAAKNSIKYLKV